MSQQVKSHGTRARHLLRLALVLLASGPFGGAWAAAAEDRQPTVWDTRELTFTYVGFTTLYSCDGLRDKVHDALIALGARSDLDVAAYGCTRPGEPERIPSLKIKVSTLKPAATASAATVEARWKTVTLAGAGRLEPGDCELAEQIQREILPLFTTRNLKVQLNCIPHQQTAGNLGFSADVLVAATP
jgi:hypothetical protein